MHIKDEFANVLKVQFKEQTFSYADITQTNIRG